MGVGQNDLLSTIFYRESTLSVVSAANVAHVFYKALDEISLNVHRQINTLNLLTQRDVDHIQKWNQHLPPKINACVHDLVLRHAQDFPQSPAVCSWDGDLTYQQLADFSLLLAKHLTVAGVQRETLVPVCFTKSLHVIIAMVAIHRAGGAFVLLDPSHPQDRLDSILQETKASVILAGSDTAKRFDGSGLTTVEVSRAILDTLHPDPEIQLPQVKPDNAAFVLFTSGSTGKPKGIVQEHASVCTNALAHGQAMKISSQSRVFQYAAFAFDVSMMDIFTTMLCGGCVCMPSELDRLGEIASVMDKLRVNWTFFTPSIASLIKPEDIPTLETLALGGEVLKEENISRWSERVSLFNCYGPAESGACAIAELVQGVRPANVGRQFGGGLNWVVDPENHDRLLPIGKAGELLVEGPTLARGYLNDLSKTRASFIESPAWPPGTGSSGPRRVYKTGDLVRQNSDGTFEYIGRKDHQLKVRGQRVELGEIEFHLANYPNIAFSTVVRPLSGTYSQCLVAVIQLQLGDNTLQKQDAELKCLSEAELSAVNFEKAVLFKCLKARLPGYMVPQHLLVVNRVPLSLSGKIDRRAVEAWVQHTTRQTELDCAKGGSKNLIDGTELVALEICSKILSMVAQSDAKFHISLYGSDFSLASIALDSIQYISLMMHIRQHFDVKINLEVLMRENATVRSLARAVERLQLDRQRISTEGETETMQATMALFASYKDQASKCLFYRRCGVRNVFVTGVTGFLGTRILYQLCKDASVGRVVVHVRSPNSEQALKRVVEYAQKNLWWKDEYLGKLEAWAGDLAKPKLGLKADQWSRLCGNGDYTQRITSIIHNGAVVNWNATLLSLKAANVDSTIDLLKAAANSAALTSFVFISGGQQLRVTADDETEIAIEVMKSSGYAQSKFLAELMVKDYAREAAPTQQHVSIVKPGYIIGTVEDGLAPTDDYIWRLAATCLDNKIYNAADIGSWLFVSDVDRVASRVTEACSIRIPSLEKAADVVKILDGLPTSDFWNLISHTLNSTIHPLDSEAWMTRICSDIVDKREKHCLWPLLQTVERGKGLLGAPHDPRSHVMFDEQRVKAALIKNVEYLGRVGFLRRPTEVSLVSPAPALATV